MNRNYWDVYVRESGGSYIYDDTIPVPNDELDLNDNSAHSSTYSVNGEKIFVAPENKRVRAEITFMWRYLEGTTVIDKIKGWINNSDKIKVATHNNNIVLYGKFRSVNYKWLVGQDGDYFDVSAIFDQDIK